MEKNPLKNMLFFEKIEDVAKYWKNGFFDFTKNLGGVMFFEMPLNEREFEALHNGKKILKNPLGFFKKSNLL